MKSLKETLKSGTIEKNRVNQSIASDMSNLQHLQGENGFVANIYNKDNTGGMYKKGGSRRKKGKESVRKENKQSIFHEGMSEKEKSVFDLFGQHEPSGRVLIIRQSGSSDRSIEPEQWQRLPKEVI